RGYRWSAASQRRLEGVHEDLRAVMTRALALTPIDLTILEGLRTVERRRELVAQGASQPPNSRHLTGQAVDVAPWVDGRISVHGPHYHAVAPVIFRAAEEVGVEVEWGGNWPGFPAGPHWQLPWSVR